MKTKLFVTVAIALTAVACNSAEKDKPAAPATANAPVAVAATGNPAEAQAAAGATSISGTVTETMNASGYTYVAVRTGDGEQWAAIPESVIEKGTTVTINVQMVTEKFESKTLNRKFDRIIFGTLAGAKTPAAAAPMASQMPPGHPSAPGAAMAGSPMGSAVEHMKGGVADAGPIKVAKAEGANGKTVAEIWAARKALVGKPVAVRGKVVKFLPGIMGRNWVHLRDGSGSAETGDNDITITTAEMANVGDVVLVTGVVHADKDFGAGYTYAVIVEDGKIAK
ncbi:MAG: nucleotide-binding protein [Thermoanaerobaculia bacterium]